MNSPDTTKKWVGTPTIHSTALRAQNPERQAKILLVKFVTRTKLIARSRKVAQLVPTEMCLLWQRIQPPNAFMKRGVPQ